MKVLKLNGNIEELISQLQSLLETNKLKKTWKGDNETNIPDEYKIKVGGYFNGKEHLHKVEIIITPKKDLVESN
jgi:hypothetical protein